jgi:hypothetical protein
MQSCKTQILTGLQVRASPAALWQRPGGDPAFSLQNAAVVGYRSKEKSGALCMNPGDDNVLGPGDSIVALAETGAASGSAICGVPCTEGARDGSGWLSRCTWCEWYIINSVSGTCG